METEEYKDGKIKMGITIQSSALLQAFLRNVSGLFLLIMIISCNTKNFTDMDKISGEVWATVKAHNKAWSELEDLNEQIRYVHKNVEFIKPPFKEIIRGIDKYRADYEDWMSHAKVDYFKEVNPVIKIYGKGKFAIVTYNIEMSFTYDGKVINDWKGADMLTLVKEDDKWLITSDMYARETVQTL